MNRASANNFLFAQKHISRFQDQNFLVDRSLDEISLRRAIPAFASLQQVKLLRLQDREDEQMQKYIRRRNQEHNVCLDWEPACTRAVANLSMSLLDSNSFIRFIAPQVCPEAALNLIHAPASTIAAVGNRLASLDLNFHSTTEVTSAMRTLSPIFRIFFPATTDTLSALHLGFSSRLPAEIPLEQIFHRIHWRKLRTLSLQSWNLHLDDLTGLLHRHRRQLRDLRLVNILLRDGKWVDVLSVLRDELDRLDRLELRDIDYSSRLSANGNGDTPPTTIPSRDLPTPDPAPMPQDLLSFARKPTPPRRLPDGAMSWDELRGLSPDQLGDDGVVVKRERIPLWEAWALCRPRYF